MWLLDLLSWRWPLWRRVTDRRLANLQGDLLRVEAKVDDDHFRLHKTLGELSTRVDGLSVTLGQLAYDLAREQKHLNMVVRAADLIATGVKDQRRRIEQLETRADEADRQIVALVEWTRQLDPLRDPAPAVDADVPMPAPPTSFQSEWGGECRLS